MKRMPDLNITKNININQYRASHHLINKIIILAIKFLQGLVIWRKIYNSFNFYNFQNVWLQLKMRVIIGIKIQAIR